MLGEPGCFQIYTGDGKGKTTAALGLAVRASGQGANVVVIQFMKGWEHYGELSSIPLLSNVKIYQTGRPDYVYRGKETAEDFKEAQRGLSMACELIEKEACDLLILDEICVALDYGLISLDNVLSLIKKAKSAKNGMELVMTGRNAKKELIDIADLVTEMREIKHPYSKGMEGRKGIEF